MSHFMKRTRNGPKYHPNGGATHQCQRSRQTSQSARWAAYNRVYGRTTVSLWSILRKLFR